MTREGKERLAEGGMEGAYLGTDGAVHIPGKRVTLYSEVSPTYEEMKQVYILRRILTQFQSHKLYYNCTVCIIVFIFYECSFLQREGNSEETEV